MVEYRFRLHHNNKIESTVNTQPLSFSTPPSTVNSQQFRRSATGIDITTCLPPFFLEFELTTFLLFTQIIQTRSSSFPAT